MKREVNLDVSPYRALIFDMDGVVTRTAALHAQAWKHMFDRFLETRPSDGGSQQSPFDIVDDYRRYVDGKPRLEGLRSFLESRGIDIPWGDPSDAAGTETVHGLGKLKNQMLNELIERRGVETFPGSVLLAGRARIGGLSSAVVTSSKNGPLIMGRSGLMPLFDALVDGNVASELSLRGKPDPDIMVEAARRLGVNPGRSVLFEDALSGVQSGRAADMGLVVGVARAQNAHDLAQAGADLVVDDLSLVRLLTARPCSTAELASARDALSVLGTVISHVPRTVVFLDYDGTLTPIVERPELARLSDAMRDTLSRLAKRYQVAVISGRDLEDVRSLVGVDGLFYAGSHGFEIAGPEGMHSLLQQGREYLPVLDAVEETLHERLDEIEGVLIERKRLSVAVHFRLSPPEVEPEVSDVVDGVISSLRGLRRSGGKKVIEVQPDVDWDKGRAVEWLLERLGVDPGVSMVIYVGDDLTDEDAFRSLRGRAVGIVVRDATPRDTYADLALSDPDEVRELLDALIGIPRCSGSAGSGGAHG